ncbi:hypothetical protein L9F63_005863, partial [Diploptera punctata]
TPYTYFNLDVANWRNITVESMNALDRKRRSLLRKLYPNTILLTQKSVHAIIIVEIRKLPDE